MSSTKLIVNFFGVPGRGKSTLAARLFSDLKMRGIDAELIQEYAKELCWEGKLSSSSQQDISKEQIHRELRLLDKVGVIITDSPSLMGLLYCQDVDIENKSLLRAHRRLTMSQYETFDILLSKTAGSKFNNNGRLQTETQSDELQGKLEQVLKDENVIYKTYNKDEHFMILNAVLNIIN